MNNSEIDATHILDAMNNSEIDATHILDEMNNSEIDATLSVLDDVASSMTNLKLSEQCPVIVTDMSNYGKIKGVKPSRKSQIHPSVLKELGDSGITPLKKNSLKFPNAAFYCNVCDYHCDTIAICRKHIRESRHMKSAEALDMKATISVLPKPNKAQEDAITDLIINVANESGMNENRKKECEELHKYVEGEIQKIIPDISLLLNGSCLSGVSLESSGLDLDLFISTEKAKEIGNIFEEIYKIVSGNDKFQNSIKTFSSSYPQVCFTHIVTQIDVSIGLHNEKSIYTNNLISQYCFLDSRVKILSVAFRYWAKLCEIDKFSEGTLAARCFPLMVIYFLQRCNEPVVPCLHTDRNDPSYTKVEELVPEWKSKNESSVGVLWLEMFRFYAVGINFKHYLIDITSPHYLSRTSRRSIKMAIEEPLCRKNITHGNKWILSQSMTNNDVFYYIFDTIRNTFFYFLVPQLSFGAIFNSLNKDAINMQLSDLESLNKTGKDGNSQAKLNITLNDTVDGDTADDSKEPEIKINCNSTNFYDIVTWPSPIDVKDVDINTEKLTSTLKFVDLNVAHKLLQSVEKQQLVFRFKTECFTRGDKVPLRCSVCHLGGHSTANCTEFDLPPLCPLPPGHSSRYNLYKNALTIALKILRVNCQPKENEQTGRMYILSNIQNFIRELFPDAILQMFGSSANGFGFGESDLDVCLMFKDNATGKDLDQIQIIKNLAQKFKSGTNKKFEVRDILAITTAKVPIVKFYLLKSCLEVDISLYNVLALRNTQLLSAYTRIDDRVQTLGYGFKYMAKVCNIGDASRGSLSSYAYIILVLHYLQNCSPPVIPVLQELHNENQTSEHIVDGWNTYFYDDLKNLPNSWDGYGKNKMSLGQLWIGLMRYYTETFDWDSNVVSIKQLAPLTRLEKMWNTQCIAIEDPFDLNHNLGGGLSRRMSTFIMKCFIRGREVFCARASQHCSDHFEIINYGFSSNMLMDGNPPNDRGCRCCGKIGHIVKECPRKKLIEEKKKEKRKREEQKIFKELKMPIKLAESVSDSSMTPQATSGVPINQNSLSQQDKPESSGNSYTASDFFQMFKTAGPLSNMQPIAASPPQIVYDSPVKPEINPPPGFSQTMPNHPTKGTDVTIGNPLHGRNIVKFDGARTVPHDQFFGTGANDRKSSVLENKGRINSLNRSFDGHASLEFWNSNVTQNSFQEPTHNSFMNQSEVMSRLSLDARNLPVGFQNRQPETKNNERPPNFSQNGIMSRQIPSDAVQRQAQAEVLHRQMLHGALNKVRSDAFNRQAHVEAINRQPYMNTWNRQLPVDAMSSQFAVAPMGQCVAMPGYAVPSAKDSRMPSLFSMSIPDQYSNHAIGSAPQHMMMYRGTTPLNTPYNTAEVIPPGYGSPLQYPMPNSQISSPDVHQQQELFGQNQSFQQQ